MSLRLRVVDWRHILPVVGCLALAAFTPRNAAAQMGTSVENVGEAAFHQILSWNVNNASSAFTPKNPMGAGGLLVIKYVNILSADQTSSVPWFVQLQCQGDLGPAYAAFMHTVSALNGVNNYWGATSFPVKIFVSANGLTNCNVLFTNGSVQTNVVPSNMHIELWGYYTDPKVAVLNF
jgi:hypothetical protein